jgi:murein DD-endopeptidase MepM/ murein hydrolase activator NlpD/photosystem II stability/assembly factor-like uncharacterized protein
MKITLSLLLILICALCAHSQPTPVTLASGLSVSSKITMDTEAIYWAEDPGTVPYYVDASDGMIRKVGKNGGTIITLASGLNHPTGVFLDGSEVYFIERGSWPSSNGTIKKVSKDGGSVTVLASGLDYPQGAGAIEAPSVYFADPCNINKVGMNGGGVTTIATDVCWGPGAVTVDHSGSLYYILVSALTSAGGLKKVSVDGGSITTLATVSTGSNDIALDASHVYWTEQGTPPYGYPVAGSGVLKKVSRNGGTAATLALGLNAPRGIAFDSESGYVYWIDAGTWTDGVYDANTGSINRIPASGGATTTVTSGLNAPYNIQMDATDIYWSETPASGVGTIKKMLIEGQNSMNLSFPLRYNNWTAYTAVINSVFDHSMTSAYSKDEIVIGYTGEEGRKVYGVAPDVSSGYMNADGTRFQINGYYSGGSSDNSLAIYLYYDGHPGYDYRASDNTPVYAAADGVVRYPLSFPGISDAVSYHTLALDHGNGYISYYLHLSSYPSTGNNVVSEGQSVKRGDLIAYSGHAAPASKPVGPHLHYEIQYEGVPVDPYGWQGLGTDPYTVLTGVENIKLWIDNPPTADFWQQTDGPDKSGTTTVSGLALGPAGQLFASTTRGCLESGALGVFLSTNNGTSWTEMNSGLTNTNVGSLTVTPGEHLFAGTQNGIFRSTDSGNSWSQVGLAGLHIGFLFSTPTAIFATDGCFCSGIYRSLDDGTSWVQMNSGLDDGCVNALSLSDQGSLFAGSGVSGIYRSTDNGIFWDKKNSGLLSPNITSIVKGSSGELYAGTQTNIYTGQPGAGVFRSTDNGESWQQITSGLPTNEIGRLAVNSLGYVFAAISGQGVYRSLDKGNSWEPVGAGMGENSTVSAFAFDNSGYVFAAAGGIVYRSVQPVTHVQHASETVPSSFLLSQNYPNPFNPSTTIEFALPKSAYVMLRVYDVLGRQVAQLVNEKLSPGTYTRQWDARDLASGVYFYRLSTGDFVQTKKLLLLR